MPGQRRRRRQQQENARRDAERFALEAGSWEVLFSTQDGDEWAAYVRRLRSGLLGVDEADLRADVFCGRLVQPTTYRLSRFVPHPAPAAGHRPAGE